MGLWVGVAVAALCCFGLKMDGWEFVGFEDAVLVSLKTVNSNLVHIVVSKCEFNLMVIQNLLACQSKIIHLAIIFFPSGLA